MLRSGCARHLLPHAGERRASSSSSFGSRAAAPIAGRGLCWVSVAWALRRSGRHLAGRELSRKILWLVLFLSFLSFLLLSPLSLLLSLLPPLLRLAYLTAALTGN